MNNPDFEFEEVVNLQDNLNNKMSKHNFAMWLGIVVTFMTGAVSAHQNGWNISEILVMVSAGLMAVSHSINGNTD